MTDKKIIAIDFSAIELRCLAHALTEPPPDPGPTDPIERARWKKRNHLTHYSVTGRLKPC